ncbi:MULTISPECIES: zinc ribbon domain-containing protein [unclassified Streptomyces]|uniref:zinc ribbon domain-containing protein n=2 Tax=Streptomyces TaxID=1883 RepID=UPI0033B4491B
MIRAYKFLMRPTTGQQIALGEMLRDHCSLYNGALQERRDAYRHVSRTTVRYGMQSGQLKDIRASAGREVIAVDPRNTSRTCPECGHVSKENRPTQETFLCQSCGHTAHADTVGALNVLRAGLVRRNAHTA